MTYRHKYKQLCTGNCWNKKLHRRVLSFESEKPQFLRSFHVFNSVNGGKDQVGGLNLVVLENTYQLSWL